MTLTPEQRSMRARLGGYSKSARTDARESTAPARAAFLERFTLAVDPRSELPEPERRRRATALRKSYFTRLALRSSRSRSTQRTSPASRLLTEDGGAAGDSSRSIHSA